MQCLDHRSTSQLTNGFAQIGRLATDVAFDFVELGDACQHFSRERRLGRSIELVERPPRVGPAESQLDRGILARFDQVAEPGIAVHLQGAPECSQVGGRVLTPAIFGVHIGCCRVSGTAPRPIVDCIAPKPPGLGLPPAGLQHRQRGLVGEHLVRRQHRADHQLIERLQPPACASHPGAERRTVQRDALALEHLRLTIERQRITKLADHHMRDQCFGGHAAVDWPLRRRCLHHSALAATAAVARTTQDLDPQLGGDDVELLGAVFTDHVQHAPAARTLLALGIDDDLEAWQVCRQRAAIAVGRLGAPSSLRCLRRVTGGFVFRSALLLILQAKPQLIEVELLGTRAKPMAQQTLDQQQQLLVLGLQLRHHLPQHTL